LRHAFGVAACHAAAVLAALGVLAVTAGGRQAVLTIAHEARSLQPGEVVLLRVRSPEALTAVTGRAFGRDLRFAQVANGEWQALAGIDLDVAPGPQVVDVHGQAPGGAVGERYLLTVEAKQFGTRTLKVDPRFVTPPKSALPRIERERARVAEAFRSGRADRLWSLPFAAPLEARSVSSFGVRSVFNGTPRDPHGGADLASPEGTPVHAPNAGRVVIAADHYFSGNTVFIDHGAGVFSILAHLSRVDVTEGSTVARGDRIGLVGRTGRVTGPHLHWAVRVGGARVDPYSLLAVTAPAESGDAP
jgi:murein DD-endopeptidase MepM/ murein hydrolase activator NlpD